MNTAQVDVIYDFRGSGTGLEPVCAGTIISSYLVLTVVSCLSDRNQSAIKIRVNGKNQKDQIRTIDEFYSYAALDSDPSPFDVAVIRLNSRLELDDHLISQIDYDRRLVAAPEDLICQASLCQNDSGNREMKIIAPSGCSEILKGRNNTDVVCMEPVANVPGGGDCQLPLVGSGLICRSPETGESDFLCGVLVTNSSTETENKMKRNWKRAYTSVGAYSHWIGLTLKEQETVQDGQPRRVVGSFSGPVDTAIQNAVPYQLSIRYDGSYICGGVILDKRTALSAASCFTSPNITRYRVVAGEPNLLYMETPLQIFKIEKLFKHPEYRNVFSGNDLAIIHIKGEFSFTEPFNVWISSPSTPNFQDVTGTVMGWGKSKPQEMQVSNGLRSLELELIDLEIMEMEIMDQEKCNKKWPFLKAPMVCGLNNNSFSSTCLGDSGGPLVIKILVHGQTTKQNLLVGISSFGPTECEHLDTPHGFTNVSFFYGWIEKNRAPSSCLSSQFQCFNGKCIGKECQCDKKYDCPDGSDEKICPENNLLTNTTTSAPTTSETISNTTTETADAGGAVGSGISGVGGAVGSVISGVGGAVGSVISGVGGAVGSVISGVGDSGNQNEDSLKATTEISSSTEKEDDDCSEEEVSGSREDERNDNQFGGQGQPQNGGDEDLSPEITSNIIYPNCSCSADSTNETTTTTTTIAPPKSSKKDCKKRKHGPQNSKEQSKTEPQEETCPLCKCPARYPVCFYTGKHFQGQMALATSLPRFLDCWPVDLRVGVSSLRLNEKCVRIYSENDCTGLTSVIFQNNDADRGLPDKNKKSMELSKIPFKSPSLSFSRCLPMELEGITNCGWKMNEGGATKDNLQSFGLPAASSLLGRSKRAIKDYSCSLGGAKQPPTVFTTGPYKLNTGVTQVANELHWGIDHVTGKTQRLHTVWYQRKKILHHRDRSWYNRVEWFRVQFHWVPELRYTTKWNPVHETSFCAGRENIPDRVYNELGLGQNAFSANRLNPHVMQAGHIVADRLCGTGQHSFNFYPQFDAFNNAWGRVEEKLHKLIADDIQLGRGEKWVEFSFHYPNNTTNVPLGFMFTIKDVNFVVPMQTPPSREIVLFSDYREAVKAGAAVEPIFKIPGGGTGFYYNIKI